MIGLKFGRLTIIEKIKVKYAIRYRCICDCGNETVVYSHRLKGGYTKSCGCYKREVDSIRELKHGQARAYNRTKEYQAWLAIKTRCYNINYKFYYRYGGRGIKVCDEWINNFQAFFDHIGEAPSIDHSIDRINNNGNYEPGNVRWATSYEQRANRD